MICTMWKKTKTKQKQKQYPLSIPAATTFPYQQNCKFLVITYVTTKSHNCVDDFVIQVVADKSPESESTGSWCVQSTLHFIGYVAQ